MREVKFRAWNSIDKCFCDNSTTLTNLRQFIKSKHYHPMQYTGLNDRNGVEICEGDILSFDWRLQATNEIYAGDCEDIKGVVRFESAKFIVRYFNESMSFDVSDINQVTFERFWRETYPNSKDAYYKMTGFEIIGNIHENPELLGE